jgi:uncharacterized protein (DUF1501 family)
MIHRRLFLKSSGLALVAGGFLPGTFVRMAAAATPGRRRALVVVFQRGAVDGLNMVVPYAEKAYYDARPSIAVPRPGKEGGAAIDLDGFFGLHPSLEPLAALYRDRSLAFVHAAGSPDPTRSHFDAQDFLESGTPGRKSTRDGFLSRALAVTTPVAASPLRAVAVTPALPRILAGEAGALAIPSLDRFGVRGGSEKNAAFEAAYRAESGGPLAATAKESFEAVRLVQKAAPEKLAPANGATYSSTPLARSMKQIAQLLRADVGLEVAFADVGGWDTHAGQGGSQGQLAGRLRDFGATLNAFSRDLGSRMSDVTLVTVSEFGRTVRENGNRGTDHGHANVLSVMGGGVAGGKVYGRWPGLAPSALFEGRDLAVTTDFRDVFAELLEARLGVTALGGVFPGWTRGRPLGLIAA